METRRPPAVADDLGQPDPPSSRPAQAPGSATATADPAEIHRRLNATAPTPLAARMRSARLVGERKPVTALFADIVGSTGLAETIDPEDWTGIINGAFDLMSQAVFDFEGTIAQLQGDALISFFGAPVAHEDDPERAVRAAMRMLELVEGYGRELKQAYGFDFRIRVGISTGIVLVGNVGSDLRYDYTAIGDTMNVAARLQAAAPPGGILIADRTQRFVAPLFELHEEGPLDLRGKTEAVIAYRVLGAQADVGRVRGLAGLASPMVGRDAELAALLGLCDTVRAGRGRIAILVAEPGLGKSRLVAELRAATERDAATHAPPAWVTAQALSYGRSMALHLVHDLIRRLLGVGAGNSAQEVDLALRARLEELLPEEAHLQHAYLGHLLGVPLPPDEAEAVGRLEGSLIQDRIFGAALRLIRAVAEKGPLVVALEDLHWADESSAEFVKGMLTLVDDSRILVLATTREELDSPGWEVVRAARERFGRALTEIRLEPLAPTQTRELVANLLEIESLPGMVREVILSKAEGNPFFVEEVIRMLIERGAIEHRGNRWVATGAVADVEIPDTVHGLVLARIDRLPAEARAVLRIAAVIDRQFSVPLLEEVCRAGGATDATGPALGRLEGANLLVMAAIDPELEYRFSHALVQDAAYESVLRQERREWHRHVAESMLRRYPDRERELAGRLARHLEQAGEALRASDFYAIAAADALGRSATPEARVLYERAAALLPARPGPDEPAEDRALTERRAHIGVGRLASGFAFFAAPEGIAIAEETRVDAEAIGDLALQADAAFWEGYLRRSIGELPESSPGLRDALERARTLGERIGDDVYRGRPLVLLGEIEVFSGRFDEGIASLETAEPLLARRRDFVGASMVNNVLAFAHAYSGRFDLARQRLAKAVELADQGDPLSRLDAQLSKAMVDAEQGDYPASATAAGACLAGAEELGSLACAVMATLALGQAQIGLHKDPEARLVLEHGLELSAQNRLLGQRLTATGMLSSIMGRAGQLEPARMGWQGALDGFEGMGDRLAVADTRYRRAMVFADRGIRDEGAGRAALDDLERAIATYERLGARPRLARALRCRGRALHLLGRDAEADEALARSAAVALETGLRDGPWPRSTAELPGPPPIAIIA